ncbi:MAG: hypothetical protein ABW086_08645 [Sedimenticola sp.]
MTKTLLFKKSALLLATFGLAGGSALSLATLGTLQVPEVVDVPVEVVHGGALPAEDMLYVAVPRSTHFEGRLDIHLVSKSKLRLITSEQHYEKLAKRPPLTLDRVEHTEHVVVLQDELGGEIEIMGLNLNDSEHEKVLLLLTAHLLDDE